MRSNNIILSIKKLINILPNTIKAIGFVSFLLNMSSVMVFSLFGVYLCKVLKVDFSRIAFLDGAVEASSFIMKLISGYLSDVFVNRKGVFLTGAIMLLIAKPLEASGTRFWPLFFSKILERLGNGTQSTPRDALVGDWAPKTIKTSCFGFRQSMAAAGSVAGALVATFLFYKFQNFQKVFWWACLPSLLAVIAIIFFIKNKQQVQKQEVTKQLIKLKDIKNLSRNFWILLSVAATYNIAKVSESILILYVTIQWTLPFYLAPLVLTICHIANCLAALPTAMICDRINNRENIFIFGLCLFIMSDILLIYGKSSLIITICALCCFGIYSGIAQSIFPAKIVELVPQHLKGTGLGIYNLVCALSLLFGGTLLGTVADKFSINAVFYVSITLAILAITVLFTAKSFKLLKDND